MTEKFNIGRFVRAFSLILVLLTSVLAKGYVNTMLPKSSVETQKEVSNNKEEQKSVPSISNLNFEATLSIFAVEFDDFSKYVFNHFVEFKLENETVKPVLIVSTTRFFRVMFSRILSINAP